MPTQIHGDYTRKTEVHQSSYIRGSDQRYFGHSDMQHSASIAQKPGYPSMLAQAQHNLKYGRQESDSKTISANRTTAGTKSSNMHDYGGRSSN